MTRLEKAYQEYPNGLIYEGCTLQKLQCCPYFIDMGDDNMDEDTLVESREGVIGCRGITCVQCWGKQYSEVE